MSSGRNIRGTHTEYRRRCRVQWSNPSSRMLLTFLFLLSLYVVACYDWVPRALVRLSQDAKRIALRFLGC